MVESSSVKLFLVRERLLLLLLCLYLTALHQYLNESVVLPVPDNLDKKEKELLEKLNVSLMDSTKLEEETRKQHESAEWFQARKMRFTASKFGRVARRKKNFEMLCFDLMNAKFFTSTFTSFSQNMVIIMSRLREDNMKNIWIKLAILCKRNNLGFLFPQSCMFLDVPQMEKSMTLHLTVLKISLVSLILSAQVLSLQLHQLMHTVTTIFILNCVITNQKLKEDHEYYDEIQGQMGLTGAKWCDFIVYTKAGMSIERILFNYSHWDKLRDKLCSVYFTYFLPAAAKLV